MPIQSLSGCGEDLPGDHRPMTHPVAQRRTAYKASRLCKPALEVGVATVDAGVEHGNPHGHEEGRRHRPEIECMDRLQIPLLGEQRIVPC